MSVLSLARGGAEAVIRGLLSRAGRDGGPVGSRGPLPESLIDRAAARLGITGRGRGSNAEYRALEELAGNVRLQANAAARANARPNEAVETEANANTGRPKRKTNYQYHVRGSDRSLTVVDSRVPLSADDLAGRLSNAQANDTGYSAISPPTVPAFGGTVPPNPPAPITYTVIAVIAY